ncbi:MAG: 1-acyl-sn-glycerol-3-phosphate acyltransferase [Bacteroidales bacterium]|nr:1-acyl-sn-glycerol-3-phosphate acyltransferase [Bacteroidales bacterium]
MGRWIPGFVYRFLSRMLRIDFVNDSLLYNHGYKKNVDFARASMDTLNVTLEVIGREHLPRDGRFIFVANHPLGGFDGMMIISEISRSFPNLKVLANDLLCQVKNMDGIFVPINKHGAQATENVRRINTMFESDLQVMTFPAGLVSRRKKGVIRDTEWQKSIITKAQQTSRDIIPIHVSGRCTNFFYNLSNFRKFLGIKANLEMFFLPNESYKHRNGHFVITFGKPIPFQTFDKHFTPVQWAARVKDYTYTLSENPEGAFSDINK